uniref:Uncharacterized protein n=1 Tax=Panagrellus redivivus TaxID=6233 RepID=A0A7E4V434_PANRE
MFYFKIAVIVTFIFVSIIQAVEVGREVEGGFEVLNTGPIQLIIPEVLSFTIPNEAQCKGLFRICYLSDPKASRRELEERDYVNIGGSCPTGYCTLSLQPVHVGVFGLSAEWHDGNFYGMLVEGSISMCPRYVADGLSTFTVIDVPNCPVIIDAARLPIKETVNNTKDKTFNVKWIIAICIGLALLLLIAGIVGLYICTRHKKEVVCPVKSSRRFVNPSTSHPRTSPINKRDGTPHASASRSPKTPPSYKEPFGKTESSLQQISPNTNPNNISNGANDI